MDLVIKAVTSRGAFIGNASQWTLFLVIIIIIFIARLPSNLKPTIREFVRLVTCGHMRSCDKDGGHTIQSAISENTMLHAKVMALCYYRTEIMADQSFTLREY